MNDVLNFDRERGIITDDEQALFMAISIIANASCEQKIAEWNTAQ